MSFTKRLFFGFFALFLFPQGVSSANLNTPGDSIKAMELFRTAVNFGRAMEPDSSLFYFEKSLVFFKRYYGDKHYRLANTYNGMAIQYKNLYQLDDAIRFYRLAVEMYLFNGPQNDTRLGDFYNNIGNSYRAKGNFAEATRYHRQAKNVYDNSPVDFDYDNYLVVVYNLANSLHLANHEGEALSLVEEHLHRVTGYLRSQFLNLKASIFASLKRYNDAMIVYQGLISSVTGKHAGTFDDQGDQYVSFAQFFIAFGQPDSALKYLLKAESAYLAGNASNGSLGELYISIGTAYASLEINSASLFQFRSGKINDINTAIDYYRKAMTILNGEGVNELSDASGFRNSNFPVLNLRAMRDAGKAYKYLAYLSLQNNSERTIYLEKALQVFSTASDLILYLRTGFISDESKQTFSAIQGNIFSYASATAAELFTVTGDDGYFEIAFRNAERNKAATLFDRMSETQARQSAFIPDSLTAIENLLNSNIAFLNEKLFDEQNRNDPSMSKINDYKNRIFEYQEKRDQLKSFLEDNYAEYFQMKYQLNQVAVAEIQKKLRRNEILIEYVITMPFFPNDTASVFAFAITKKETRLEKGSFSPLLADQIETVFHALSSQKFYTTGIEDFVRFCQSSFSVYSSVVEPFKDMMDGKRLIVVPDGLLNYVPFEGLLTSLPEMSFMRFHDLPYLILDYPVGYAYSAETLYAPVNNRRSGKGKVLAFAPKYPDDGVKVDDRYSLAPIPGVFDEVDFLKRKFRTTAFIGEEATEAEFRSSSHSYGILHLAMHALVNDSLPMFSRLAFYPGHPDSLNNDGWMNTSDIYNMELRAGMAVLSACNTGSGRLLAGEGIMSLARAFMYAGCPAVIMTLWEVEDRTGTSIMKEFYKNLKWGKAKDQALRNAKLKHIKNADPLTAHPHFWLSYICIGDTRPIFNWREKVIAGVVVIVVLVQLAGLFWKKPARKSRTGIE